MRVRRSVAAVLLVAGLTGVSSCGNAVVPVAGRAPTAAPVPSPSSPSAATPASSASAASPPVTAPPSRPTQPTPSPATLVVGDRTLRGWPAGVLLPNRTTVVTSMTDARGGAITFSGPSRSALVEQLSAQLADAGLSVVMDSSSAFHFRGTGWVGQVAVEGADVTMRWLVGDAVRGRYPVDVGLGAGVPVLMRYPDGAVAASPKVQWSGSSYDLVGRPPSELLSFYRSDLMPLFSITGDLNENGVTTLTFSDGEYDSVITATETSFRVVHSRRS